MFCPSSAYGNASGNAAVKGNVNHIIGGNGYRGGNCFRDSICCNRRPSSLHSFGELHHFQRPGPIGQARSEEHTSEIQSLMSISYAVFCLKKKKYTKYNKTKTQSTAHEQKMTT